MAKILYCMIHIIKYNIYCLFLEESKGSGNITHTNNKNKEKNYSINTVTLKFKHPEILQQFNNNIEKQYNGVIRGNRIKIIEDLLTSYNKNLKVIAEDPEEVTTENLELKKINDSLLQDKQQLQANINELTKLVEEKTNILAEATTENKELKKQIKELNNRLSIKDVTINNQVEEVKEKAVLEETLKNKLITIDGLNKKLEKNSKEHEATVKELKQQLTIKEEKITEANTQYKKLLQDNKEEIINITKEHETSIAALNKDYQKQLKEKEEDYKRLTAYTFKIKDDITEIKSMNLINRILKRYPEEEAEEVKELPIINTH